MNLYGKGSKIRTAYLLPRAAEHIRIYLKAFHEPSPNPETYLFYSRVDGKYVRLTEPVLEKRIKVYAADARKKCPEVPVDAHAYQFCHAKATYWMEDGEHHTDRLSHQPCKSGYHHAVSGHNNG